MSRSRNAPPSYDEGSQAVIAEEHPSSLPDTRAADALSSDAAQPNTRFFIGKNTLALGAVCSASLMFGLEIL